MTRFTTRTRVSLATGCLAAAVLAAVLLVAAPATAQPSGPSAAGGVLDGLADTPPMGFNNWNSTQCGEQFNEDFVRAMADLFVETGLKDAGYEYINLDDCWARSQNSPEGSRDENGNLVPDPERFPSGIEALADYVHSKGLKIGIYTSAGTRTCNGNGFDGALGHEYQDAAQFAAWGIDYLKYDNCNNQGVPAIERYTTMRDALVAAGRPMVYSITEWGQNQPWLWAGELGHLWRTTGDITPQYETAGGFFLGMSNIAKINLELAEYAGPGHWNDPDMLQIGNGTWPLVEQKTHFSLWSIMAAPLLIGTDLREATPETMEIFLNTDVIAVDQDPLGVQGELVRPADDGHYVIAKPLANGDVAVALWNDTETEAEIDTSASELGLPDAVGGYQAYDLWTKQTRLTNGPITATVPAHGTAMFRVSAQACTEVVTGRHVGRLTVSQGTTCVTDATVTGPVTVRRGAGLVSEGARLTGPVTAEGAALVKLCDTKITGPVTLDRSSAVMLGDPAGDCEPNTVVGPVRIDRTAGPSVIAGNRVVGSLRCAGNDPPPVNHGYPNQVFGPSRGQCSHL